MAHVVAPVARELECARFVAVEIHDIDSHHVAVAEAVVVHALPGQLVNLSGKADEGVAVGYGVVFEDIIGTSREGSHPREHIGINELSGFHIRLGLKLIFMK